MGSGHRDRRGRGAAGGAASARQLHDRDVRSVHPRGGGPLCHTGPVPVFEQPPNGNFRRVAGLGIGLVSGFAGVGGGILTNVVMVLSGVPMHKSIGRAAAVGVVVGLPATLVAAFASTESQAADIGSINLSMWACIAPAQAVAAWFGARLAQRIAADNLSRVFACALALTGVVMLRSSIGWP